VKSGEKSQVAGPIMVMTADGPRICILQMSAVTGSGATIRSVGTCDLIVIAVAPPSHR
jgi:hypothetical protein